MSAGEWATSVGVVTAMMVGLGAAATSAEPAAPDPAANLVSNGTFDQGSSGWHGNSATGLAGAPGESEGRAIALRNVTDSPQTLVLNDRDDSVAATVAGHTYKATASVRVHEPEQSVVLRLREWDSASGKLQMVGQEQNHHWVTTTEWQTLEVEYIAETDGATLDLNVVAYDVAVGDKIDVDNITLIDATAAGEPVSPGAQPAPVAPAPKPEPAPAPVKGDWQLVFSDEFSGTEVNRDNWTVYDRSTYGDGNNELACLMDRPENVSVADGVLTITARAEKPPMKCGDKDARFKGGRSYSSGFLDSRGKVSFEYGRFEARVKTPNGYGHTKGLWPAFWLRPDDGGIGEIDIFEIIGTSPGEPDTSNRTTQSIHYDYVKTHPKQNKAYDLPKGNFADEFHTHAVEWGPGFLRFYVDDVLTYERTINTTPWLNEAFSGKFHMRLNMAVGGTWTGSPDAHTRLPADFEVDYVRVYQKR